MSYEMCVDIGGTFTDLYLRDGPGEPMSFKTPTTYHDLTAGIVDALEQAAEQEDSTVEELLGDTDRFIHGTTISTNAILEDETAKTALICTEGFRDTLTFREGGREHPYELHVDFPEPYIPRSLTYGVTERVNAEGEVEVELDNGNVREVVDRIREEGCEAVAVALLWSHINPKHERRIAEIIEDRAPELDYSLSHEVNPIVREYRRTSSTAIDASLLGPIQDYMSQLKTRLTENGFDRDPLMIAANGGVMQIDEIAEQPIWSVDSGPTMLPVAAHEFASSELNANNVIALDMGGTSLDMGVVRDGTIPRTREAEVGNTMLSIEKVEVKSIGSGGGSIASVDEGGLLHVGPQSAGAEPGPACYGRGGEKPTLTDAALVLGYLNGEYFLGGEMTIDRDLAEQALEEHVGNQLGIDAIEAAHAVYSTANQDMVNGIREVTIERGIDPRNYVLSGGGGALGVHAAPIARELQVTDILLPSEAGVVSSIGGLHSDLRRDFSATQFTESDRFDLDGVNDVLTDLNDRATSFFDRIGVPDEDRSLSFYTEARYPQQVWEIEVEVPAPPLDEEAVGTLIDSFHRQHEAVYGYQMDHQDIEFLYWRVEASAETSGRVESVNTPETGRNLADAHHQERQAFFGDEVREVPAYRGDLLEQGHEIEGPAFVDAKNTTVVLEPDNVLTVTDAGNYHIRP